jgi:hypothetical protein
MNSKIYLLYDRLLEESFGFEGERIIAGGTRHAFESFDQTSNNDHA